MTLCSRLIHTCHTCECNVRIRCMNVDAFYACLYICLNVVIHTSHSYIAFTYLMDIETWHSLAVRVNVSATTLRLIHTCHSYISFIYFTYTCHLYCDIGALQSTAARRRCVMSRLIMSRLIIQLQKNYKSR